MPVNKGKVNKAVSKARKDTVRAYSDLKVKGKIPVSKATSDSFDKASRSLSTANKVVGKAALTSKGSSAEKTVNKRIRQSVAARTNKQGK